MSGDQALVFFLGGIPGLSALGARQFAAGQPVTGRQDRQLLASTLCRQLGLSAAPGTAIPVALLLPAVQKVRDAARRTAAGRELTAAGAQQFLLGQPVSDAGDAALLAGLMASGATAGRIPGMHKLTDVTLKRG